MDALKKRLQSGEAVIKEQRLEVAS
jgi:hypothetical protein